MTTTDPTTTETPAGPPADAAGTATPGAPGSLSEAPSDNAQGDEGDGRRTGNAEAARYRVQLRAVEAERDTLRGRVDALLRREAERHAADVLAQGGDLFAIGAAALPDLLDEAGDVDPDRVRAAATSLVAARPGLHKDARASWPDMGQGSRESAPAKASWDGLLRRGR